MFSFHEDAVRIPARISGFLAVVAQTVTRALQQYSDSKHKARDDGMKPFVGFVLTADGIRAAGRNLPKEAVGTNSFCDGMRSQISRLGDPSGPGGQPTSWEDFYAGGSPLHGAWLIAHKTEQGLADLRSRIEATGHGVVSVVHVENAVTMRDKDGFAREPFGFRDGISMPKYFVEEEEDGGLVNPPLEQVLLDSNGPEKCCSFMVFRKLEQHVDRFRAFEERLGKALGAAGLDSKDAGRCIVGRYPDGRPLVAGMGAPEHGTDVRQVRFSFKGDMGGSRCPFSAHIRKSFFRQPQVEGGVTPDAQLAAQFVRRGMLFGAQPFWPPPAAAEKPTGLLFLAYMADISGQFEKLQAEWFRGGEFPVPGTDQPDPLLFGSDFPGNAWSWPARGISGIPIERFVTPLGGAYFFVPSVSWLQGIGASPLAPLDR